MVFKKDIIYLQVITHFIRRGSMTDKKEKILKSALVLFAEEGYRTTSTCKVARHAGVSEGLIFRHFGNKAGLLNAIIKEGEEKAKMLFADIVLETNPEQVVEKTLGLGKKMIESKEDADFWKLQYKIKWEMEMYGEHKMEPLEIALTNAFMKLGYEQPELEARLLLVHIDGLATRFFLQKGFNLEEMVDYVRAKFKL